MTTSQEEQIFSILNNKREEEEVGNSIMIYTANLLNTIYYKTYKLPYKGILFKDCYKKPDEKAPTFTKLAYFIYSFLVLHEILKVNVVKYTPSYLAIYSWNEEKSAPTTTMVEKICQDFQSKYPSDKPTNAITTPKRFNAGENASDCRRRDKSKLTYKTTEEICRVIELATYNTTFTGSLIFFVKSYILNECPESYHFTYKQISYIIQYLIKGGDKILKRSDKKKMHKYSYTLEGHIIHDDIVNAWKYAKQSVYNNCCKHRNVVARAKYYNESPKSLDDNIKPISSESANALRLQANEMIQGAKERSERITKAINACKNKNKVDATKCDSDALLEVSILKNLAKQIAINGLASNVKQLLINHYTIQTTNFYPNYDNGVSNGYLYTNLNA